MNGSTSPPVTFTAAAPTIAAPDSAARPRTAQSMPPSTSRSMNGSLWKPPTPYTSTSGFRPTSTSTGTTGRSSASASFHTSARHPSDPATTATFSAHSPPAAPNGTSR